MKFIKKNILKTPRNGNTINTVEVGKKFVSSGPSSISGSYLPAVDNGDGSYTVNLDNVTFSGNIISEKEISAYGKGNTEEGASDSIVVYDALDSTDPKVALSANQGRVLKELIDKKPSEGGGTGDLNNYYDKTTVDLKLGTKADTTYVDLKVIDLVNGAPETMDTLKELSDAIANNKSAVEAIDASITNKADKIHKHTKADITDLDLTPYDNHIADSDIHITATERTAWNNKVDKVTGKGLSTNDYTTDEKNKLKGIEDGANKYIHPETHPATMITTDKDHRFVTDAEKTGWNDKFTKQEINEKLNLKLDKSVWDKAFYFEGNDLKAKVNVIGEKEISAYGKGETGGTTGVVNIADNLTTNDSTYCLSAKQGVVLKGLIDNKTVDLSGYYTSKQVDTKLDTKANKSDISDMLTKTVAANTYLPKGNYLPAGNYLTQHLDISHLAKKDGSNATGIWNNGALRITSVDTRNDNYNPNEYTKGLSAALKLNSINGLNDGGTYNGQLTFRSYDTDMTAGPVHQLGFTSNGNIWNRYSKSGTEWNQWKKLADTSWVANNYATNTKVDNLADKCVGTIAYTYGSGCLVATDIPADSNKMVTFRIEGNSYLQDYPAIFTVGLFYDYSDTPSIFLAYGATHYGYNFGDITAFDYKGKVYLWFIQHSNFQTFNVYVFTNGTAYNQVTSISNVAMPTSGVTKKTVITPKEIARKSDITNTQSSLNNHINNSTAHITSAERTKWNNKADATDVYSASVSRTANTFLAAPNGSNGAATFRKIVPADVPIYTLNDCTNYTSDDRGATPAAIKKAFGIFKPKAHNHQWTDIKGKPDFVGQVDATVGSNYHGEIFNNYSRNQATGKNSHAEGVNTLASGEGAHAENSFNKAIGNRSHAEGVTTYAIGEQAHSEGEQTRAIKKSSHSEGKFTIAGGEASHTEGNGNYKVISNVTINSVDDVNKKIILTGDFFTASFPDNSVNPPTTKPNPNLIEKRNVVIIDNVGYYVTDIALANGLTTLTIPLPTTKHITIDMANPVKEIIVAKGGVTNGFASHSEGCGCVANGDSSHAEGFQSVAEGDSSHTEGYQTKAFGNISHSEGIGCEAKGNYSHSQNYWNQSIGDYSTAMGKNTRAIGISSTTMGDSTNARGDSAIACGFHTTTHNQGEAAFGVYNHSAVGYHKDNTLFSVGCGDHITGRNGLEVSVNGDVYVKGVGGYDGTGSYLKDSLSTIINQLSNSHFIFSSKVAYPVTNCVDYCTRDGNVNWLDSEINEPKNGKWTAGNVITFLIPCTDGSIYVSKQKVVNSTNLLPLDNYYIYNNPFHQAFYFDSAGNIHIKVNAIGDKEISAYGKGDTSTGTGAITIVDSLASEATDAALSARLGKVLASKIDNISTPNMNNYYTTSEVDSKFNNLDNKYQAKGASNLLNVVSKSGTYYAQNTDDVIIASGDLNLYLPASISIGKKFYIKGLRGNITLHTSGGSKLIDQSSKTPKDPYGINDDAFQAIKVTSTEYIMFCCN